MTIPLSDFPGLNTSANLTGSFHARFWYGSAFTVDILSVKLNGPGSGSGTATIYPSKHYNTDSSTPTKHIFAGDQLVGTISGSGAGAVIHTVATDHLTGSNVVTNSSGTLEELMDYYPYGDVRLDEKAGSFSEQRKFAGHELDTDTGLSYMNARYYNGKTGRFVSQDAAYLAVGDNARLKSLTKLELERYLADPQLANSYSYVANNPLKYTDSTGDFLDIVLDVGFIGYDLYRMGSAAWKGNWGEVKSESVNLGLDTGSAFVPGLTGLGTIRRAAEAAKVANRAGDAGKAISKGDVIKHINTPEKIVDDHALREHIQAKKSDFGSIITNRDEAIGYVKSVMEGANTTFRTPRGNIIYDKRLGGVIFDTNTRPTFFQPKNFSTGKEYFLKVVKDSMDQNLRK